MATYIIRAGLAGPVKIGKADDVNQRLRELQTGNHERLSVLRVIDTPFDAEPLFHLKFARNRLHGEWFEFEAAMLTFVPEEPLPDDSRPFAGDILRFGIKKLATRIGASVRTVEGWVYGKSGGPQARFTFAMLQDPETAPIVLRAAGLDELANPEETIRSLAMQVLAKHGPDHPALQRPDVQAALKAALVSEGK